MNGYAKHNIYVGAYSNIPEDGRRVFVPPPEARWIMRRYQGDKNGGIFSYNLHDEGRLVLILEDEEGSFWPVMSFLDDGEAASLAAQITEALGFALSATGRKVND